MENAAQNTESGMLMEERVGTLLDDKYLLTRILGRGGMGAVFEAQHTVLNRHVAIKILQPSLSSDPKAVQRFIREGQAASAISHPNVIDIQDFGRAENGTAYIVMELLKGDTLSAVLDYRGMLPTKHAVTIILQVLSALCAAHKQNIIHRDLKPENIYLTAGMDGGEMVKLVDFGVARFMVGLSPELRLTRTGTVLGTPYYLAPEQANGGKEIDHRIDLWSAGVVFYEMLTGRLPFEGENYNEVIASILMNEHTPVLQQLPDLPPGLGNVVDRALCKDRENRFANAEEMIEALMPFYDNAQPLMNSTVISALRDSIIPESPEAASGNGSSRRNSNPMAETMDSSYLNMTDSQPMKTGSPIRTVLLVVAAMVAVGVVLWVLLSGGNQYKIESAVSVAPQEKYSVAEPAQPSPVETPPPGPSEQEPTVDTPPKMELSTEMVKIELTGLPKQATVTINGEVQPEPLTVPKSTTPVFIKVSTPGYLSRIERIIPSQNQELAISLTRKKPAKKNQRQKSKDENNKISSGNWRSNPFAKD